MWNEITNLNRSDSRLYPCCDYCTVGWRARYCANMCQPRDVRGGGFVLDLSILPGVAAILAINLRQLGKEVARLGDDSP